MDFPTPITMLSLIYKRPVYLKISVDVMYVITIRYSVKHFEVLSLYGLHKEEFGIPFCIYNYICSFMAWLGE